LNPSKCSQATIFIIAAQIKLYPREVYERGLKVNTVPTQRIPHSALSPAIKSLNYLNNILAKIEGNLCGAEESVMLNHEGYVAECTGDNIFVVKRGVMLTPPVYAGSLPGITRDVVINLARQAGYEVRETMLTRYDLFVADEVFLTGTAAEIVPVAEIDGRRIMTQGAGPVTRRMLNDFTELTKTAGVRIYAS
jgi:branched-chain amino acid aminotransferase